MSEPEKLKPQNVPPASLGVSKFGCLAFLAFVFLFFFLAAVGLGPLEPPLLLVFGWIAFLERTLPRITWNWDIVGMGLLCVVLILFLAHRFLTWLAKNAATARATTWRWPWKWTWCGLSAVMVFFLVGMAVGGMAHQIGWIITSPDPWFEIKGRNFQDMNEMRLIEDAFRAVQEGAKGDPAILRQKMLSFENDFLPLPNKRTSWMETYEILFVLKDNKVTGLIVFPRDPQRQAHAGAVCSLNEKYHDFVGPGSISDLIRTNQQNLVSF